MAATTPRPRPGARRRVRGVSREALQDLFGAAAAGICSAFLLFGRYAPFSGPVGFVIIAYVVFLAVWAALLGLRGDRMTLTNGIATALMCTAAAIAMGALFTVILTTIWKGHTALVHVNFFTQDMSKTGPLDPLSSGGIAHALVGTIWMIGIALVLTAPLGILAAIYLYQSRSRFSRFVRSVVEAMTALPTILAGLYIYAAWILTLGNQKSGLAAALALSVMMLPYIIRGGDLVLRLVPGNLVEASSALGAPRWRTTWHVVLPTARSGLATAVILGVARGIGEASPVLLTAGFTTYMNTNPLKGPMVSLPLLALKLVQSPEQTYIARGYACASFLLLLVLGLFIIARIIGGEGAGHVSARGQRRLERASARDIARYERKMQLSASSHEVIT